MEIPAEYRKPRKCVVNKKPDFKGYGFNLHTEKGKPGQFIGKVELNSPADDSGIEANDVILEVNGVNVEKSTHQKVVELVKSNPNEVTMLVCNIDTVKYCRENGIPLTTTSSQQPAQAPAQSVDQQTKSAQQQEQQQVKPAQQQEQQEEQQVKPAQQQEQQEEQQVKPVQQQEPKTPAASTATAAATATAATAAVATSATEKPKQMQQQQQKPQQKQQQQQQQQQPKQQANSAAGPSGAAGKKKAGDPVGSVSLDEIMSRVGQNKRSQVMQRPTSFAEKHTVFQQL